MGIFNDIAIEDTSFIPYLNTNTLFDIVTGAFVPGINGEMILNGGLAYTNGFPGRPQMFKSTEALSFMLNAMFVYDDADGIIHDTEFAQQFSRLANFIPDGYRILKDRLKITNPTQYSAEELFALIMDIANLKVKKRSDYEVETPFLDFVSGKPKRILKPTLVAIDSFSKLQSSAMQEVISKSSLSSSDQNMIFMKDGAVKSKFVSQLPIIAARYGIYFILTAHIGNKFDMNPMVKSPKELQHMKSTDKIKHVGADFDFLMSNLLEMRSVSVMQDDKKKCLYPNEDSNDTDLNLVAGVLCRCKNNSSASATFNAVISQRLGFRNALTNYHYLKENDYFGLIGSNIHHKPALYPDVTLQRTTARDKLEAYKTLRAIEIIAQLCYVRNSWNLANMDRNFKVPVEEFAEKLIANQSYAINDILESRGYWTYSKTHTRPYLSIYDILGILEGKYKPKLISTSVSKK